MTGAALEILDEGSWALMIEESNVRALQKYRGSMADLDIDYYLSVGTGRYYKGYFSRDGLDRVRDGVVRFLLDDAVYHPCVSQIHDILARLRASAGLLVGQTPLAQFELYCELLREYIAYYNSVITDTFYTKVFDRVDAELAREPRFATKSIKDSLFATNNNDLLTHLQTVDMMAISRRHLDGLDVDEEIKEFVERYRSTTISSGSPNGITEAEVRQHLSTQTADTVRSEKAFLDNLHFRYDHADTWSERAASAAGLDPSTRLLIRRASELSYLKIKMREVFQEFKVTVRGIFLNDLVAAVGKHRFDYMRIDEIADFLRTGTHVPDAELERRRTLTVFELKGDDVSFLDAVPESVEVPAGRDRSLQEMSGDVLVGAGSTRYRVLKVEQHEAGLHGFDEYLRSAEGIDGVAVVTNVLRPHLVPKLRKFGALLTQYGGYTSHASVLCRELGINSMISVDGLLGNVESGDHIEVDFDRGTVVRLDDAVEPVEAQPEIVIDLAGERRRSVREVGAKAANLMRIRDSATIANGFVITSHAVKHLDDVAVRTTVLDAVAGPGL
ncbi:PEP-utilizing enzyme [Cellulomonas sp. URHB0016]